MADTNTEEPVKLPISLPKWDGQRGNVGPHQPMVSISLRVPKLAGEALALYVEFLESNGYRSKDGKRISQSYVLMVAAMETWPELKRFYDHLKAQAAVDASAEEAVAAIEASEKDSAS